MYECILMSDYEISPFVGLTQFEIINLLKPSVFLRNTRLNIQNFYMVFALS
jgi:hypothetical protein